MGQTDDVSGLMHEDGQQIHPAVGLTFGSCCGAEINGFLGKLGTVFRALVNEPSTASCRGIEGDRPVLGGAQLTCWQVGDFDLDAGESRRNILADTGGRPTRDDGLQQGKNVGLGDGVIRRRAPCRIVVGQLGCKQFLGRRKPSGDFDSRIGRFYIIDFKRFFCNGRRSVLAGYRWSGGRWRHRQSPWNRSVVLRIRIEQRARKFWPFLQLNIESCGLVQCRLDRIRLGIFGRRNRSNCPVVGCRIGG